MLPDSSIDRAATIDDTQVLSEIDQYGFAKLGVIDDFQLKSAQALLKPAPHPGEEDVDLPSEKGFAFLAADTGLYEQANRLIRNLSPLFRLAQVTRRVSNSGGTPHLDGFGDPKSELIDTPDAVLGIYLSAVPDNSHGAFTVWPNDRDRVQEWFRRYHTLPPRAVGHPEHSGGGKPVTGPAGTAFVFHGAALHCQAARTVGSGSRDAVFFRLFRRERAVLRLLQSGGTKWDY